MRAIEMEDGDDKKLYVAVFYCPSQTEAWSIEEYKRLKVDSPEALQGLQQEEGSLILVGDLNMQGSAMEVYGYRDKQRNLGRKVDGFNYEMYGYTACQ